MPTATDLVIADTLRRFLAAQLQARPATRAFFRISSFGEGVYTALLDALAAQRWRLGATPLEVRSIDPIPGHRDRLMDAGRSATWYRNHLAPGQALVLIQNRLSADAQSLKDLYPVTELSLSTEGLAQLIEAGFARYQLSAEDRASLSAFVRRMAKTVYEPQLRDLAEFLAAVDRELADRPGTALNRAIVLALPHLGLFRCLDLEQDLGTARGEKLLRQLHQAARIGAEVLDERTRSDYLRRLEGAPLSDDETLGGLTKAEKRLLLRQFIDGHLRDDPQGRLQVLLIDWREIQLVITAKSRVSRQEKLSRIADQIATAVSAESDMETVADILADLRDGREPDSDTVDRFLGEQGEAIPQMLRTELRRLVRMRIRKHSDILVGLTALAIELLQPLQGDLLAGTRLHISPKLEAAGNRDVLPEALATFRVVFGGVTEAMPGVDWRLDELWDSPAARSQPTPESDDDQERERLIRLELPFRVIVYGPNGDQLARGELIWQYRSDSPVAATALTLAAEQSLLRQHDREPSPDSDPPLRVPVFNNCPTGDEVGDLDLRRPIHSLGAWFEQPSSLRDLLAAQLNRRARAQVEQALAQALDQLELAWGRVVAVAAEKGLLAADLDSLIEAYEGLLQTAACHLRTSQEATAGFRALSYAWIIGPQGFDRWAVMPLLHPLKLLWWRERTRYFNAIIHKLLDPTLAVAIVDEPRYRRELAVTYGSSGFPPVLALPPGEGRPSVRFLPVEEADGYELYVRESEDGEPFGLDTEMLADDEAEIAAQRAVEGITAVVQDYFETYPFVRDGLELVLYECRNGALPGLLIERLAQASDRRGRHVRLTVIVHTSDLGAPLFQRVSEWAKAEQALAERRGADYFPPVILKVLQCPLEELLRACEDTDIVILADVLAKKGQRVTSELGFSPKPDTPAAGWMPVYQAQQEPFQQGELYRRLLLSQPRQPAVARLFLLSQHAALERRPVDQDATAHFYRELTLDEWEQVLGQLHDSFNWVICYDPSIDRFLLESALPDKVQIIRYSLGLGAKRQHNLTVSSSHKAQEIVERRLATRLAQMLPLASPTFLIQVAHQLVSQAKAISGDIVLRAAGPGALLNELIGLVAARFETERRYSARLPEALTTWILLDDFEHWFGGGKFPDLLFVAIEQGTEGGLKLHIEVLEAKCVGQISFETEAGDAQAQVRRGVGRLALAFAPGAAHLDALYWYDQLYRAVVGSVKVELTQQGLWALFQERLHSGDFQLSLTGHSWAFCYDGQAGIVSGPEEQDFPRPADDLPDVPLRAHHYGRNELCQTLRALIESAGAPEAPSEMWTPAAEQIPDDGKANAELEVLPRPGGSPSVGTASPSTTPVLPRQGASSGAKRATRPAEVLTTPEEGDGQLSLAAQQRQWLQSKARELERALRQRGVQVMTINPDLADVGPSIVRFKLQLRPTESLKKIQGVAEDLARDLALASTPIIANVLRTSYVGVDIPREQAQTVDLLPLLRELGTPGPAELPVVLGITPDGSQIIADLSEFPHLLVAGATNSGKSVFLRGMLLSLITQYRPGQIELLIIDPKRTDFTFFDKLPHLRGGKVLIDAREARDALLELVRTEMLRRQELIAKRSLKVKVFNQRYPEEALPPIVALIDEYALLVSMMDKKEREAFEQDLMILAAAARSVGIHLVLATQRPSADVVTSTLKANLDARIAFKVASSINSRVVLDETGAENLLGRGDMLFRQPTGEIVRLQAPFMDEEAMQAYLSHLAR